MPGCKEEAPVVAAAAPEPGAPPEPEVVEKPAYAEVTVASKPAGATVTLDGAELGKTPYNLKLKEPRELSLTLKGHKSQAITVEPDGEPIVVVEMAKIVATAPKYKTANAAKRAYKSGTISRAYYNKVIKRLKRVRDPKLKRLRKRYDRGQITRAEYDKRKEAIVEAYWGE